MSYEGYNEQLCVKGHYTAQDCYDIRPDKCPHCGAPIAYTHAVDETNGYCKMDASTYRAAKVETGSSDVWRLDHYGNRYATKLVEFAPAPGSAWNASGSGAGGDVAADGLASPLPARTAQGTEARRAATVKQGAVHDGPVG